MAGLDPATHCVRVCGRKRFFARGSLADGWPGQARPWRKIYV